MRYSLAYSHARANAPENRQAVIDARKASMAVSSSKSPFVQMAPILNLHPIEKDIAASEPTLTGPLAEVEKKLGLLQNRLDALSMNGKSDFKEFLDDANYVLDDAKALTSSLKPSHVKGDQMIDADPILKKKFAMTSLMLDITLHRLSEC